MMSSVNEVRSRSDSVLELTASDSTGRADGSKRSTRGAPALSGRSALIGSILSRTSWAICWEFCSRSKIMSTMAWPDWAVDWMESRPAMVFTASSMGSTMSASTDSGEAPG